MSVIPKGVSFNRKWVKSISKARFVKDFENVYPDLKLADIYDEIVGREKKGEEKPEKQ